MAQWQPIRGISDPIPIRQFNGVYKPNDPGFNLPDGLFTELINFCPDNFPGITTRPGHTVAGQVGTGPVLGLMSWKDKELHAVFSNGTWQRLNADGTWTALKSGLNASAEWSFCNFKGNLADINLIAANGVDTIQRYDGATVQNLAGAPAGGNFITTQYNRLYCAVGNDVKFSALNVPTDWTTVSDAGSITYSTTNGETINGLNAGNQHVTAFKPSSTYELWGTGPSNYSLQPVAVDIGITGNKAVAIKDDLLSFVSRDGLYTYAGGVRPKKDFSNAVRAFMNGINQSAKAKCIAKSDGQYIYFSIPYGSATENNRILQYDPLRGNWYTWDGIAVTQMIRVGSTLYFGDATGRVLRVGGTTDNGTPITATAITKPFTSDSIARKQQWFKIWVVASIQAGSTLSVYVSGKETGEDWILAKTLTADTYMQSKMILVPTNSIANCNAVRIKIVAKGPVTIHEITRQLRQMPMR